MKNFEKLPKARRKSKVEFFNFSGVFHGDIFKNYDKSIEYFQKAIDIKPDDAKAYLNMGVAYYKKGNHDKSIEYYQKAIDIKPDYAQAYYSMGIIYVSKGNHDKSIDYYQKAIDIKPNYAEAYYSMGFAYVYKGNHDKSIECYQKAINIDPNYQYIGQVYYNIGLAYKGKGNYYKSIEFLKKAALFFVIEGLTDYFIDRMRENNLKVIDGKHTNISTGKATKELNYKELLKHIKQEYALDEKLNNINQIIADLSKCVKNNNKELDIELLKKAVLSFVIEGLTDYFKEN